MSGRGCDECGGIYMHQGMCSQLPAGSEAGKRRDRILTMRHGEMSRAADERERNRRIAANQPPLYPGPGTVVVQVVAPLTEIDGLLVDDSHAVFRGHELFVTREHWDFICTQIDVRR